MTNTDTTLQLAQSILGKTTGTFICNTEEETAQATVTMINQTDRQLDILTRYFDPAIYDTDACVEAFERLALNSRHSRIRILIQDTSKILYKEHRVLNLGKQLASYIEFRSPTGKYRTWSENFLIADKIGVIHRPHADSHKTLISFNDVSIVQQLAPLFDTIWAEATLDPNMRNFVI
ncbi:hypothetical protein BegalDRAFT_1347 [Beggiatoa alba B18LD]|uniref:DUF7931 domain-containing protein n=1 Tax=Beggiatoa alba B18LD TaxID=395493 RepID=I3CF49_9GAMM|nr:hypothetical protein [Beggiatoa alba]EIJ42242.1 hypothetical protein BegalDRAFT_1347 [Beggiatoa alba B18LD]